MQARVLVVDDEKAMRLALTGVLTVRATRSRRRRAARRRCAQIDTGSFHVVITDLSMDGVSGMQVLEHVRRTDPDAAVIMITAYGSEKIAVQAMKLGAVDYLPKPFDNDELRVVVRRVVETVLLRRDHRRLLEQVQGIVRLRADHRPERRPCGASSRPSTRSPTPTSPFWCAARAAPARSWWPTRCTTAARAAPSRSIKMNCAALSRELVESELFGHERGAFTGAVARREGKFEAADGGTLFLDEVGDMPLETQAKLLRAIQEKEFERVGGNTADQGRRPPHRRHQSGSRGRGAGGAVSRGSLLPAARRGGGAAAVARSSRGHSTADRALSRRGARRDSIAT